MSSDAIRRAIRTALQTFISTFLLLTFIPHAAPGTIPTWDGLKVATLAAVWAAATATLTFLQNALEDSTAFPALFGTKVSIVSKGAAVSSAIDPVHVVEHVVSVAPVQFTVNQVLPEATATEVQKVVEAQVSAVLGRAAQLTPETPPLATPPLAPEPPSAPQAPAGTA